MDIDTLEKVAAHLRQRGGDDLIACAVVCERVIDEQAALMAAVKRLSRRLARCSQELAKAAGDTK